MTQLEIIVNLHSQVRTFRYLDVNLHVSKPSVATPTPLGNDPHIDDFTTNDDACDFIDLFPYLSDYEGWLYPLLYVWGQTLSDTSLWTLRNWK